jgi:hypothetical protein
LPARLLYLYDKFLSCFSEDHFFQVSRCDSSGHGFALAVYASWRVNNGSYLCYNLAESCGSTNKRMLQLQNMGHIVDLGGDGKLELTPTLRRVYHTIA